MKLYHNINDIEASLDESVRDTLFGRIYDTVSILAKVYYTIYIFDLCNNNTICKK